MSCVRLVCACLVMGSASCLAGGDDFPPPRLSTVVPASGSPGQPVMLLGEHFCATPDDHDGDETEPVVCDEAGGSVQFGREHAESYAWMMTSIGVTVPLEARPGPTSVRVNVAGRTSNSVTFHVELPRPTDGPYD